MTGDEVNKAAKNSTDMTILPNDLENPDYQIVSQYIDGLLECYQDYTAQWEFLGKLLKRVHIGPFNIQKYDAGGHFVKLHSERTSIDTVHRILVWMTYLNDVPEGGETEFPFFDLKVIPEKRETIIWPAEWTHAHRGGVVTVGPKYVITGWMHFAE